MKHLAHLLEGLGFLVVCLGGIALAERRPRLEPAAAFAKRPVGIWAVALMVAAAAGVHVSVMPEHFHESWMYGTFFAVTATAQLAYAAIVVWRPTRSVIAVGAAANAAVVGLWLFSRLVEVPLGPDAGTPETFGARDIIASGVEIVAVACAVMLLVGLARQRRQDAARALDSRRGRGERGVVARPPAGSGVPAHPPA